MFKRPAVRTSRGSAFFNRYKDRLGWCRYAVLRLSACSLEPPLLLLPTVSQVSHICSTCPRGRQRYGQGRLTAMRPVISPAGKIWLAETHAGNEKQRPHSLSRGSLQQDHPCARVHTVPDPSHSIAEEPDRPPTIVSHD
jgi:hypothetical protein